MTDPTYFYFDVLPLHRQPLPLESFTSYVSRLAEENGLRTTQELSALFFAGTGGLASNLRSLADFPLPSFGSLPGVSASTCDRLSDTTYLHLARKFGHSDQRASLSRFLTGALAPHLRYCPICLANQETPYYSLLWRFLHLTTCPVHGCPLLDRCAHCGSRLPLFVCPPHIPFCGFCQGDLRECLPPGPVEEMNQALSLSGAELSFLLSVGECEAEEHLPALLGERLAYKAKVKSMRIVPGNVGILPRWELRERPPDELNRMWERGEDESKIRQRAARFLHYLGYTRFLRMTFLELFSRSYFTALSSDAEERSKQVFVLLERPWRL